MGDLAEEGHHQTFTQLSFMVRSKCLGKNMGGMAIISWNGRYKYELLYQTKAMKYRAQESLIYALLAATFLFYGTGPALGIVLHPDGEPNLANWTDRPDPNVIGRWGSNASCVAVSSNCVITTRHQGGGVDTYVDIGGNTYIVTEIWNCDTVDLRIAKLYGANLTSFVGIYEYTNETNKEIVMGGYGKGRGILLDSYGYTWSGSSNQTQRWGQNKVNGTGNVEDIVGRISDVIIADFDGYGVQGAQPYEAAMAEWDSGGGWFIYDGNKWKVAGLSRGVTDHDGESWFNPPDSLDAVRVSSYAWWISQTIPERVPGDLTGDDWVDFADFAVLTQYWLNTGCEYPDWCAGADFEHDGDVDWADLAFLMNGWLGNGGN